MQVFGRLIVVLGMIMFSTTFVLAQPLELLWHQSFGGEDYESCAQAQETIDGGFILGGRTNSFGCGMDDFWMVKTNSMGDSLWSHTFGGKLDDRCYAIQPTSDNGYILAGYTESYGVGGKDFWLVKTDDLGNYMWSQAYGGGADDWCLAACETEDGDYVLAGFTASFGSGDDDFWMVKTDRNGTELWNRTFGGINEEWCFSIQQLRDGGYILGGWTFSYGAGSKDGWIVRTDANGGELWNRAFGGYNWDECYCAREIDDGCFVLVGRTASFGMGSYDAWMIKTNSEGNALWTRTFGGRGEDWFRSVQETSDDGFILVGWTDSFGAGHWDGWLVRTNANGRQLWNQTFGGISGDQCYTVQITSDNNYVLAGRTESFGANYRNFWLIKASPVLAAEPSLISVPSQYGLYQNYPNPFNSSTQISYNLSKSELVSLKVFDILGQEVQVLVDGVQNAGHHAATFDGSGLATGLYFYRLQTGEFTETKKMVLLK